MSSPLCLKLAYRSPFSPSICRPAAVGASEISSAQPTNPPRALIGSPLISSPARPGPLQPALFFSLHCLSRPVVCWLPGHSIHSPSLIHFQSQSSPSSAQSETNGNVCIRCKYPTILIWFVRVTQTAAVGRLAAAIAAKRVGCRSIYRCSGGDTSATRAARRCETRLARCPSF